MRVIGRPKPTEKVAMDTVIDALARSITFFAQRKHPDQLHANISQFKLLCVVVETV
jgi:hypothetical protein